MSQHSVGVSPINWGNLHKRYLNPGELEVLVALVKSVAPKVMLEIGCNEGRTAKAMLLNVPTLERYIGIDVPVGTVPTLKVQRNEVPKNPGHLADDPRFKLMLRPRGSFDISPDDLPKCDAVFIDGDHGRKAVNHDYFLAMGVLNPGGIVILHDFHSRGTVDVKAVLDEFYAAGQELFHVADTWLAFQRV